MWPCRLPPNRTDMACDTPSHAQTRRWAHARARARKLTATTRVLYNRRWQWAVGRLVIIVVLVLWDIEFRYEYGNEIEMICSQ